MAKMISKRMHKKRINEIKQAAWQYLIDHSSKDADLECFVITCRMRDQNHFYSKIASRMNGYSRKNTEKEQKTLNDMIYKSRATRRFNSIRNKKIQNFYKSRNIIDMLATLVLKPLLKYRESRLEKL